MATLGYVQGQETEIQYITPSTGHAAGNHPHFALPAMPENGVLGTINIFLKNSDSFDQQIKFFIASAAGNILWESAAFTQTIDPSTTTVDASSANLSLASGNAYQIGYTCQSSASSAMIISKAGAAWYNDPGTWPTVNNPVSDVAPSGFATDHTLLGHITYTPSTPETRKSSNFDIETTLGTITTATLDGVDVFDHVSQAGTTVSFAGAATDEITTSGEYSLVLGDGAGTETITVQVNVVGLASFNINKHGADQGSLTDVEFIILTGAAGSRAINDQIINVTTTVGGDTGAIEITDAALNAGDTIMVAQRSDTVSGGGGAFHPATLGLI